MNCNFDLPDSCKQPKKPPIPRGIFPLEVYQIIHNIDKRGSMVNFGYEYDARKNIGYVLLIWGHIGYWLSFDEGEREFKELNRLVWTKYI